MSKDHEVCRFEKLFEKAMKNRRVYEEEEASRVTAVEDDELFVTQNPGQPDVDSGPRAPASLEMSSYEPQQQTLGNQPAFANGYFPNPSLDDSPTDNPSEVFSTALLSLEPEQNFMSPAVYGDYQYLNGVPNDNQAGVFTSTLTHEHGKISMPPTEYGKYSYMNNLPNDNQSGFSRSISSHEYGQTSMPQTTYGGYSYLNNAPNGNQSGVSTSVLTREYGQPSMSPTTYGDHPYLNNAPNGNQSGVSTSILSREYGQPSASPTAYGDHPYNNVHNSNQSGVRTSILSREYGQPSASPMAHGDRPYNSVPNDNPSGPSSTSSREYGQALLPQQSGSGLYPNSYSNSLPSNMKTRDPRLNQQAQPSPSVNRRSSSSDIGRPGAPPVSTESRRRCTCFVGKPCELAAEKGVVDCRSLAPNRSTKPRPSGATAPFSGRTSQILRKPNRNNRRDGDALRVLDAFRQSLRAELPDHERIFNRMRRDLHDLQFSKTPSESQNVVMRYLDGNSGFPAIIRSNTVPWDIRLDAEMLLLRWQRDDLSPELDRGIIERRTQARDENGTSGLSRTLNKSYPHKLSPKFEGEGHLRNGQWWPWRIAAIRDGAHGEIEAGIFGYSGVAVSIVLSCPKKETEGYRNIDQGTVIRYCGTLGKDSNPSAFTKMMIRAQDKGVQVRVLRSARTSSANQANQDDQADAGIPSTRYFPSTGLRYDGLYTVVGREILSQNPSMYRFRLQRCENQTPIRYSGRECRPTKQETAQFEEHTMISKNSKPRPTGTKRKRA